MNYSSEKIYTLKNTGNIPSMDGGRGYMYDIGNSGKFTQNPSSRVGYSYNLQGTTTMGSGGTSQGAFTTTENVTTAERLHEKEELQRFNDRFSSYILKVRQMDNKCFTDSGAFIKSAKILEEELVNLKALYEKELKNVREQLDGMTRERNSYQAQFNKNQQSASDMQGRLSIEVDKSRKLMEEMQILQKRISTIENELKEAKMAAYRPLQDIQQLQIEIENFSRENEMLKNRLEKEHLLCQEAEERLKQTLQKMQFADNVNNQQTQELKGRLEHSTATILTLEARIREARQADKSIPDLLKQVREAAAEEFRKYQIESEANYSKNIAALKAQMDSDANRLERMNAEKSQLMGSTGELKARITSLEGQIQTLNNQKASLESIMQQERRAYAEQIHALEKKLQGIQEILFIKIKEASVSRETSVSLKAEIQSMKILLDEEEKRLTSKMPLSGQTTVSITKLPVITSSYVYKTQ